jgi:hypothetical protein
VRTTQDADAPVAQGDQVCGHRPGTGAVRRGDGHDVARQRAARIDHDERVVPIAQREHVGAVFGRQDQYRAVDVGALGEAREGADALRRLTRVENEAAPVQLQGLGDRGDDHPEAVHEHVRTAHVDGRRQHIGCGRL